MFGETRQPAKKFIKVNPPKEFSKTFGQLNNLQKLSLSGFGTIFEARQNLMIAEHKRLEKKYGADNFRTIQMKNQVAENVKTMNDIQNAFQISDISPPTRPPGCVMIHGRVLDENRQILKEEVLVCNRRRNKVDLVCKTKSGYYSFLLTPKQVNKLGNKITLQVYTLKNELIHWEHEFEIDSVEIIRELILNSEQIKMCHGEIKIESPTKPNDDDNKQSEKS